VASGNRCKRYIIIASGVIEHTARATIAQLRLFEESFGKPGRRLYWFFDCGNHFRNYAVLHYTTVELVKRGWESSSYNSFETHHGKGGVDALFSKVSQWVKEAEKLGPINNEHDIVEAIQKGAGRATSLNPTGAKYTVALWEPSGPPPKTLECLRNAGLEITKTYCVQATSAEIVVAFLVRAQQHTVRTIRQFRRRTWQG
jgi:hypothetical protein